MEDNEGVMGLAKMHESFTDEEYKASKCMHYSILKDIYDNPDLLTKEFEERKEEWMVFGTLVDMLVTEPASYVDENVVINDTVPSDQYKAIVDYLIENEIDISSITDQQVEDAYVISGSKVNWTLPVKKQKLLENCTDYLKLLTTYKDKLIVSSDLFNEATLIAQTLTTHEWTKDLFRSEKEQKQDKIELLYQYKVKSIYRDIVCKIKVDILYIDHQLKLICPYDVKTGSDLPRTFIKNAMLTYKYLYQEALYKEILKSFFKNIEAFKDYEIDEFRFVYVSRLRPTYPVILRINDATHYTFVKTGVITERVEYPSLDEIIESISYYIKNLEEGKDNKEPMYLRQKYGEVEYALTEYFV